MKPTVRVIRGGEEAARFFAFLGNAPMPYTVSYIDGDKRSINQNSTLHGWFNEIAKHRGDCTMMDVKGEMHQRYGLPIKLQDEQFAWVWERTGARMNYEQQCKFLASGVLQVSSNMTKPQLSEYMDAMMHDCREQGIFLTDPNLQGYDG